MRLVPFKIFYGIIGAAVRKTLVRKAEDVVGGYFECIGQADEQIGIRYGYTAFNPAQGSLGDADFHGEGFLCVTLLQS